MSKLWWIVGAGIGLAGAGIGYLLYDATPVEERYRDARVHLAAHESQAMVAWRDPAGDTEFLFPGATLPSTDAPQVLSLSRRRREIQDLLGPDTPLAGNALYVYQVEKDGRRVGAVLLRRARGEWGAIEIVVGIKLDGTLAGARIQRHREPPGVARHLMSRAFLDGFTGKNPAQRFALGVDLPPAPREARPSAQAVALAVRALCIEYHAGSRP